MDAATRVTDGALEAAAALDAVDLLDAADAARDLVGGAKFGNFSGLGKGKLADAAGKAKAQAASLGPPAEAGPPGPTAPAAGPAPAKAGFGAKLKGMGAKLKGMGKGKGAAGPGAGPGAPGAPGGGGPPGKAHDMDIMQGVMGAVNGLKSAVVGIPGFIMKLRDFLVAIAILLLIVAVLALVIYLMYYIHPRMVFFCNSQPFSDFMDESIGDMQRHMDVLRGAAGDGVLSAYASLIGQGGMWGGIDAGALLDSSVKPEEIARVLRFWDSLASPKLDSLAKADLGLIDDEKYLNADGEPDPAKLAPLFELRKRMEALQKAARSVSNAVKSAEASPGAGALGWVAGLNDDAKIGFLRTLLTQGSEAAGVSPAFEKLLSEKNIGARDSCGALVLETYNPDKRRHCHAPLDGTHHFYCELKRSGALDAALAKRDEVVAFIDQHLVPRDREGRRPAARVMEAVMAAYELHLMLNLYFEQIRVLYETRKVGFRWNYTLLKFAYLPFVKLIIEVKITKEIWGKGGKKFVRNFKEAMNSFNTLWAKVPRFLGNLPKKLSGGDRFTQQATPPAPADDAPSDLLGSAQAMGRTARAYLANLFEDFYTDALDGDVVEHFGFLKGLLSIGDFFMSILGVAKGLAKLITNPFAIIMMIIGFILAAVLMVAYILLTAIFAHVWCFAFLWAVATVLMPAVFFTLLYVILIIPLTVVYTVLWIIDMATGGLVMLLMRCENLPTGWYKYATYAYGNRYERAMLACTLRCASRYRPLLVPFLGLCQRLSANEPSFCPQAVAYRMYRGEPVQDPSAFEDYVATPNTALMDDGSRRSYLQSTFLNKRRHLNVCDDSINDDYMGMGKKGDYNYYHVVGAACRHGAHSKFVAGKPEREQALTEACRVTYCDPISPAAKPDMCMCGAPKPVPRVGGAGSAQEASTNDVVVRALGVLIVTLLVLALVVYMIHAATDPEHNAVQDLIDKLRLR